MRVLIQGAGAVAGAAGALFAAARADVIALSTRPGATLCAVEAGGGEGHDVRVMGYGDIPSGAVDLLLLTSTPRNFDQRVIDALVALTPSVVAVVSPLMDDVAVARELFPHSDVVVLAPALLSSVADRSRDVRAEFWVPPLTRPFVAVAVPGGGRSGRSPERELASVFPSVIGTAPERLLRYAHALMVPFAAELAAAQGQWSVFRLRLRRPSRAAGEAMSSLGRVRLPGPPVAFVAAVLAVGVRFAPFDIPDFAGRHFVRHAGQSVDMLDEWRSMARRPTPNLDALRADLVAAITRG